MRGGSSIFEPLTGPKVLFVPRRPVPKGLGENAFFARLRAVGAKNKQGSPEMALLRLGAVEELNLSYHMMGVFISISLTATQKRAVL